MPWSLVEELTEEAVMPCLRALARTGVLGPMRSSLPAVSSVSWSSIITGGNPGEHGIYGFTELLPGSYTVAYPNFLSLKRRALWSEHPGPCLVLNVPFTYPAQPLNGCHIAGFVAPRLERAVYPYSELAALEKMGYRLDVDSNLAAQSEMALYNQLFETHARREAAVEYLWERYDPVLALVVFTGSDRLGHFGWHHWEQKDHRYHERFVEYFRAVDRSIDRIAQRLGPEDTLLVLSDHGMEAAEYEVSLNAALVEGGFLRLEGDESRKFDRIGEGTVAFALEDGRVYLHEAGRYPRGGVQAEQREALIAELTEFLRGLQVEGRPVVKRVHRSEEIYRGGEGVAPDLVVEPNPSFRLTARLTGPWQEASRLPGMHNDQAFLLVHGPQAEAAVPPDPCVEDVVSILQHCTGGEP